MTSYPRVLSCLRLLSVSLPILLVGCAGTPENQAQPPQAVAPSGRRPPAVNYALSLQGAPYRYGKESPEEGFDCSGFVRHVYRRHGIVLPRTTRQMAAALPPISKHAVQSGDLVFFNTDGNAFSHVGIYIDDSQFIHAPSERTGSVIVSNLKNHYWKKHFTGVRRPSLNRAAN